jgi:hypothetical protein
VTYLTFGDCGVALCAPGANGRYWARTSDPQLVEPAPWLPRFRGAFLVFLSLQVFHTEGASRVAARLHPLPQARGSTW